ncbi:putative nuclease HARBI1 [Tanacetum coccineum]
MNPNESDEERHPNAFEVDDETDIYFMTQAYEYHERLLLFSKRGRRTFDGDYFDDHSAIRQLAYRNTPDAFDEYVQMSEHTAQCLEALTVFNGNGEIVQYHGRDNTFFGVAGANNDINVLDNSPLFDDILEDIALVAPFVVNGVGFEKGYYLADKIYS